jgi:hypothetical protein
VKDSFFFIFLPKRSFGDNIRAFFERSEEEGVPQWASIDLAIAHTAVVDIQLDNKWE